jgi:hypothetical protein
LILPLFFNQRVWHWPIQQKPPKATWKLWAAVLTETFGDEDSLDAPLGPWLLDSNNQNSEWWLDSNSHSLYQHNENTGRQFSATNYGRLRFCANGMDAPPPIRPSHRVEISSRMRYMKVTSNTKIEIHNDEHTKNVHHYTPEIESAFFALPIHVQRLTGSIPTLHEPAGYQEDEPIGLIFITDGLVLFGVGYHGWITAVSDEQIILRGGGPDDGPAELMSSYH